METVSNPLLRVGPIDRIAELARSADAAFVVDNTFATPLLFRPLELGANMVVHSLTKYLAGHGDVLGGIVVSDERHYATMRTLSRASGPVLGPFESYLTMRGIKTFPLRMERQCGNAWRVASWLRQHPRVDRVYFPADPNHPDAETIRRLLPDGLYGGIVSFELKDAGRYEIFALMDRLHLVVRATSLGDVHSMMLVPGDEFAPRGFAEAARAHGHPRQSGADLGRHRSGGGYHRGPRSGFGESDVKPGAS